MAILKIIKEDDPILRKQSRKVDRISLRVERLIDDMIETLHEAEGAGLAAVQVGVLKRVVIIEVEENNTIVLINPEIVSREGTQNNVEGCLSIPEKWGVTNRPATVTVKALDRQGNEFTLTGTELLARAICHELDHLDGVLYTDNVIRMLTAEELEELRNGGDKEE